VGRKKREGGGFGGFGKRRWGLKKGGGGGGGFLSSRGPVRFSRRTLLPVEVVLNFYLLIYFQGPG